MKTPNTHTFTTQFSPFTWVKLSEKPISPKGYVPNPAYEKAPIEFEISFPRAADSALFGQFVRKHQLAVENFTESQLAEAIRQAIASGDFIRHTTLDGRQAVAYIPYREAGKFRAEYCELLHAVENKREGETRHETALRYIREAGGGGYVCMTCIDKELDRPRAASQQATGPSMKPKSELPSEDSLQKAAQAWGKPETQHKTMDAVLAVAFAEILDRHNSRNGEVSASTNSLPISTDSVDAKNLAPCYAVFNGKGGFPNQNRRANDIFKVGKSYVITGGTMGQSLTTLEIEGYGGGWNSVMFDYDEKAAPIDNPYRQIAPEVGTKKVGLEGVGDAYRVMSKAMRDDPGYALLWQCNIAMPILDGANGKLTHEEANKIADNLMRHLFGVRKLQNDERSEPAEKNQSKTTSTQSVAPMVFKLPLHQPNGKPSDRP